MKVVPVSDIEKIQAIMLRHGEAGEHANFDFKHVSKILGLLISDDYAIDIPTEEEPK